MCSSRKPTGILDEAVKIQRMPGEARRESRQGCVARESKGEEGKVSWKKPGEGREGKELYSKLKSKSDVAVLFGVLSRAIPLFVARVGRSWLAVAFLGQVRQADGAVIFHVI